MHNTSIKSLFDKDLNVNDLIISLSASNLGAKFIPYETIIIFDELQECANARSAIKPFMEDGRFDLICSGSLLELRGYNKKVSKGVSTGFEKENKKFQYKLVASNAKARSHSNAITWLEEFGLICKCHNLNNLELPLDANMDEDTFKIYVTDTGLFIAMLEDGTTDNIINGDLKVYKGAIFENIIADAFNKMHKDLYYYHKQSGLEIDFVTRYNNELTLIEVKSNNGNAKSLKEILNNKDKYDISSNFKLADTNIGTTNGINTIPLYMAFLIK